MTMITDVRALLTAEQPDGWAISEALAPMNLNRMTALTVTILLLDSIAAEVDIREPGDRLGQVVMGSYRSSDGAGYPWMDKVMTALETIWMDDPATLCTIVGPALANEDDHLAFIQAALEVWRSIIAGRLDITKVRLP